MNPVLTPSANAPTTLEQQGAPNSAPQTGSSTGISSTPSSITSASSSTQESKASTGGCCSDISKWITGVIESIRKCLSSLPWIGSWFAPANVVPAAPTDADHAKKINDLFAKQERLTKEEIDAAMETFKKIEDPKVKMETFVAMYKATLPGAGPAEHHMTQEVFVQFYEALSAEQQNEIKTEVHTVNGNSVFDGTDHGIWFGDHMVYHRHREGTAMMQALDNITNRPAAPVGSQW